MFSRTVHRALASRLFSSKATAARDVRLAGRQRFYKETGVTKAAIAPWLQEKSDETSSIKSPISAGVDGSQSASGVAHVTSKGKDALAAALTPRKPGSQHADIEHGWYGVTLDGRALKTPMGQPLLVPSSTLAQILAAEWNAQVTIIMPTQMPVMTLVCTALDQTTTIADTFREQILRYMRTDTIGYAADPTNDRVLYQRQQQAWEKLRLAIEERTGDPAPLVLGDEGVMLARASSNGLLYSPAQVKYGQEYVQSLDAWHLSIMHAMSSECKSFWIAWGMAEGILTVQEGLEAARTEEEFQISNWGLVEGGHDYDRLNASVQLYSSVVLKQCLHADCIQQQSATA